MPARSTQPVLIAVVAIALGALAIGCWYLQQGIGGPTPIDGNGTSRPAPTRPEQAGVETANHDGAPATAIDAASAATTRVSVDDAQRPDDVCTLQVLLQSEHDRRSRPAPFVDVVAQLADDPTTRAHARSDPSGRASFSFVGGHDQRVVVTTGIGGRVAARLDADAATRCVVTVPARAIVTGQVVDADDAAVAGADILLLHWSWHDEADTTQGGALWRIGRADRDGTFEIACGVGGRIGADHPHHSASPMHLVRAARADRPATLQTFTLVLGEDGGELRGIVVDDRDRPVAGAHVELRTANERPRRADLAGPPRRLRANADGTFRTRGLPAGTVRFAARAPGHGWVVGTTEHRRTRDDTVRIVLPRPASVYGTVVIDAPDGPPVANATVTAGDGLAGDGTGDRDSLCHARTRTAADGSFRLGDLGSGRVQLRAEDGRRFTAAIVELEPGQRRECHFVLTGTDGNQLTGVVVDERDQPLSGWLVVARQGGQSPVHARSDEQGRFATAIEQNTNLDVRAYAPGREPTSFADVRLQGVDATAGPLRIVAVPHETTRLYGRVVDSNYTGVPASVGCFHHQRREYARFRCDEAGNFDITQVPLGDVNLTVEFARHVTHEGGTLTLDRMARDLGTVQLELGGTLFGTVIGPDGSPPASCDLALMLERDQRTFAAEYLDGSYTFRGLPAGEHQLFARGDGIAGEPVAVTIVAGQSQQRDLELQQGVSRRIVVVVPPGGGRRVTLAVRTTDGAMRWFATNTVARPREGAQGRAEFRTWMLPGAYDIAAATPTGHRARRMVEYSFDDDRDVVLQVTQ